MSSPSTTTVPPLSAKQRHQLRRIASGNAEAAAMSSHDRYYLLIRAKTYVRTIRARANLNPGDHVDWTRSNSGWSGTSTTRPRSRSALTKQQRTFTHQGRRGNKLARGYSAGVPPY